MSFPSIVGASALETQKQNEKDAREFGLRDRALGLQERSVGVAEQGLDIQRGELDLRGLQRQDMKSKAIYDSARADLQGFLKIVGQVAAKSRDGSAYDRFMMSPNVANQIEAFQRRYDAAGYSNINVAEQVMTFAAGQSTAQDVGKADGAKAVASAQTQAAALKSEPDPVMKQIMGSIMGLPQEGRDEFNRVMNEVLQLQQSGQLGTPKGQLLQQRLNSLLNQNVPVEKGVNVSIDPGGKVTVSPVAGSPGGSPAALGGPSAQGPGRAPAANLPPTQLYNEVEQINALDANLGLIDKTIEEVGKNPTAFGLIGTVRRGVQQGAGLVSDLGQLVKSVTGLSVNEYADKALKEFGGDKALEKFFRDPQLDTNEVVENTLALELAKLRIKRGGGDMKAIAGPFKEAKEEVRLTGLTTAGQVKERLQLIRGMFAEERGLLSQRLTGQPTSGGNAPPKTLRWNPATSQIE